jgi:HK97 family phage major capsid protein/HK97 family phage prohead protease
MLNSLKEQGEVDEAANEDREEAGHIHEPAVEIIERIELSDEEVKEIFGDMFDNPDRTFDSKAMSSGREVCGRSFAAKSKRMAYDEEARTVSISVSSEIECERWFGREVLEHSEEAIDLRFFGGGSAPLLLDHDPSRQIGVVENVTLDGDRKLRARVRFSKNPEAEGIFRDVVDGIRSNVSVGYVVDKMVRDEKDEELFYVKSWRPMEVSVVSIPADTSVGVGRSGAASPPIQNPKEEKTMSNPESPVVSADTTPDLDAIRAQAAQDAAKAAARNAGDILKLAIAHNRRDLGDAAVRAGVSIEEFRGQLLDAIGTEKPLENNEIGLTHKERQRFSIMRLARAMAEPTNRRAQEDARMELEASEAAQDVRGYNSRGMTIPVEVLHGWRTDVAVSKRDMNTNDDSALIAEDYRASEFIDVLRNSASVMQAGARMLTGLSGNVAIPKKTSASTASWIDTEGNPASESEPAFGQVTMSPKVVGAYTDATRLMMQQSALSVEALLRDDLSMGLALAIDKGALEGSGASGQPTGVLNTSGINTVTNFAAAVPTFAETVSLETALAQQNALFGNLAYITDAGTYGGMKTKPKDAGSGIMVLENGEANGYDAIRSQQCTAGNLYFGNWSDVLIGMWDGLDILVDPYTNSTSGTVRIVALQTVDVAVRHAQSFAVGNDGA